MTGPEVALFFHILGVFLLVGASAISLIAGARLRRAETVAEARTWLGAMKTIDPLYPAAIIVIFGAGAYMVSDLAFFDWDQAWVSVSLGTLIAAGALGGGFLSRELRGVIAEAEATPEGPMPASLRRSVLNPVLFAGENVLDLWIIAIMYMMVDKPNLAGALAAVLIATAVGMVSYVPASKRLEAVEG